jgi:transposase
MRCFALDVHRDFCEVAVAARGQVEHSGRIETSVESLELFAGGLAADDQVVLEATGPAFAIARILRPHVARVVVANAQEVRAISHARVKSDRFDAATLARLLSADLLPEVWVCDERIGALRRRLARRGALVRQRTRAKNEVHAVLARCLLGRPPASDLFGKAGRAWLNDQELAEEERETVDGCLRQVDFLDHEIELLDVKVAQFVAGSAEARRLMTIPGVDITTAAALVAAIGDIRRFDSPRKLVAYLGLDPKVRQSGSEPARHGHISKRGDARPVRPGRSGLDGDPDARAAARLRRAHPKPPRQTDRSGGCRSQDRHDRLADAHQRGGLRVRAPQPHPREAAPARADRRPRAGNSGRPAPPAPPRRPRA